MKESFLSRFTPSLLSHETLEAIFVQREALAKKLVEGICESAESENKHYYLLVGPRGIGKTHVVSVVYHRVCKEAGARDKLLIAWLREEEWGIASFLHFLLALLRALVEEYADEDLAARYHALFKLRFEEAELQAEKLLRDAVGNKTLLVITENLEQTFRGLEQKGQEKLRAYIQNNPFFVILATSQSLFNGVSVRESPFYGFFETHHLQDLSFDDVVSMLRKIAAQEGDAELVSLIGTPRGRARIRAVHHLAAGNPRVYVIFAQFLTCDSLDRLVQPLMQTLDDLTPYYQGRMSYLSPQQRKIVEFLCERRHAVSVSEIAESNFLTHQTTSGQLKKLRELGYAQTHQTGRESYYELREPLMRISLEVKKVRGEPIRLLVQFLQLWYSRTELTRRLESLQPQAECERRYLAWALREREQGSEDPPVVACLRDYAKHREEKDFKRALRIADELIELRNYPSDWYRKAKCLRELGREDDAERSKIKALELEPIDADGWRDRAIVLANEEGRYEEALESCDKALQLAPDSSLPWRTRAVCLEVLGRIEEALASGDRAVELDPKDALAWRTRGVHLERLERYEDALASVCTAVELDPEDPLGWLQHSLVLVELGRREEALKSIDKALKLAPKDADVWGDRAVLLYRLGRLEESLASLDRAVQLDPQNATVWSNRGVALSALGRHEEAVACFDQALGLDLEWPGRDTACFQERSNRAVATMLTGRWGEGVNDLDDALRRFVEAGGEDPAEVAIVRNSLIRTRDVHTWRRHIAVWIELFDKHGLLTALGQGIVCSIRRLSIPWMTNEVARAWRDVWHELGFAHKELALPLRLLNAAVEYRAKPDKRVLLSLPAEERSLLEPLLGVPKSERAA